MTDSKPTILFVCTHNAGRSALGAAFARHCAGDRVLAESAGMDPADGPSVVTIASQAERGIDDSAHRPSRITDARVRHADVVVAMKPGLDLPHFPGVRYEGWTLPDPAGWDVDGIRGLRTTAMPACSCCSPT
jgi:arsenate reductase (thioredoxin)